MRHSSACLLLGAMLLLSGCDTLSNWFSGTPNAPKPIPGNRIDVVFSQSKLTPDTPVANESLALPDQSNLANWGNRNDAMTTGHIGVTGIEHHESVEIGNGHRFTRPLATSPIIANGVVVAMDAAGVVSAHDESDISHIYWTNNDGPNDHADDVLGGGLAYDSGTVYASTGDGGIRAIAVDSGKLKWSTSIGAPVHGAPAVGNGVVVVLTADNQTIAVDALTGSPRWTHRGIKETAGYYSNTSPVISNGIIVSVYSSGEIFALRAESGSMLWSDSLGSSDKTRAADVFGGIDADPIVQDGVVVTVSTHGEIQASSLNNGRPLWQKRVGSHMTPWSAGNALFVLSTTHDVAALLKRDGSVRWAQSLAVADKNDPTKDVTPPLYGPILAGNAILVLGGDGMLSAFKPQTGERINGFELASGAVTAPIITNGALYYITKDAVLHRYH